MDVTLADGSVVQCMETCVVPMVSCTATGHALYSAIPCRVLPQLNHDVVLGVDWLQNTNPNIDWRACTVSMAVAG